MVMQYQQLLKFLGCNESTRIHFAALPLKYICKYCNLSISLRFLLQRLCEVKSSFKIIHDLFFHKNMVFQILVIFWAAFDSRKLLYFSWLFLTNILLFNSADSSTIQPLHCMHVSNFTLFMLTEEYLNIPHLISA